MTDEKQGEPATDFCKDCIHFGGLFVNEDGRTAVSCMHNGRWVYNVSVCLDRAYDEGCKSC